MTLVVQKSVVEETTSGGVSNEDLLESLRDQFSDLDLRLKKVAEAVDDAAAGLRLEMAKSAREMTETRAHLNRLQSRVDNQLMSMVLANLASGVGVAALVLAATQAF